MGSRPVLRREADRPRAASGRVPGVQRSGGAREVVSPRGFTAPSVEFDPRAAAATGSRCSPPDGDPFYLSGEFREVDAPARLTYTFRWDPSDPDDRQTVATLSPKIEV